MPPPHLRCSPPPPRATAMDWQPDEQGLQQVLQLLLLLHLQLFGFKHDGKN